MGKEHNIQLPEVDTATDIYPGDHSICSGNDARDVHTDEGPGAAPLSG